MFSFFNPLVEIPPLIVIAVYIIRETGITLESAILFFDWMIDKIQSLIKLSRMENQSNNLNTQTT